jgi:hypothetical protein
MARNAGIPILPFKGSSALTSDPIGMWDAAKLTAIVDSNMTIQVANAASPTETDWENVIVLSAGTVPDASRLPVGYLWFRCIRSHATAVQYLHKQIR